MGKRLTNVTVLVIRDKRNNFTGLFPIVIASLPEAGVAAEDVSEQSHRSFPYCHCEGRSPVAISQEGWSSLECIHRVNAVSCESIPSFLFLLYLLTGGYELVAGSPSYNFLLLSSHFLLNNYHLCRLFIFPCLKHQKIYTCWIFIWLECNLIIPGGLLFIY